MRKIQLIIGMLMFCMSFLFAQEDKTNPQTYTLQLRTIVSDYGNALGAHIGETLRSQLNGWEEMAEDGDYKIKVRFLEGLDPLQYSRRRGKLSKYHYEVEYLSPQYAALITDRNGQTILKKIYGQEKVITPFREDVEIRSSEILRKEWKENRDIFYKEEEEKYHNISAFLEDLNALIAEGALPAVLPQTETFVSSENAENINSQTSGATENEDFVESAPSYELEAIRRVEMLSPPEETTSTNSIPSTDTEDQINSSTTETESSDSVSEIIAAVEDRTTDQREETAEETETAIIAPTRVVGERAVKEETKAEKRRRIAVERQAREEWERAEEKEIEVSQSGKIRPRYFRLGARVLVPNLWGAHAEVVLPFMNNHFSLVGDFSSVSVGSIFERFLDEGENFDNIDATYQYYSFGANYYFGKRQARGFYVGGSYLKGKFDTKASIAGEEATGNLDLDAAAVRVGLNMGRRLLMVGVEAGVGFPLNKLEGAALYKDNGEVFAEQISESIPIIPILNLTVGIAL